MITRCNQCGAKFEISAELVQSADPTVRCGECLSVFDASAQLVPEDLAGNYSGRARSARQQGNARSSSRNVSNAPAVTRQSAATPPPVTESKPAVTQATRVDSYAHISDDDLENAATVVIDQTAVDEPESGIAYQPVPSDSRINDGFYSPDLDVRPTRKPPRDDVNTVLPKSADKKIDPTIDLEQGLDSTSLEFERTLALENFPRQDDVSAAGLVEPTANTDATVEATVRLDDQYTRTEWQTEHEPSPADFTDNSSDIESALVSGRDYPHIPEGMPVEHSETPQAFDETADPDRHLSSEELGLSPDYDSRLPSNEVDDYRTTDQDQVLLQDQDSARDLRRYVSSRGGDIYPGSDKKQRRSRQQSHSSLMPMVIVGLLALGALYFARNTIATMNLPGPVLSVFCGITGCELPLQKDVEQLELVRHQMSSHKAQDNVLVFTVDLINRARFPQPYPVLVVTMANSGGESVAFRKFKPSEYLEEDPALQTLPAGQPVRIKFEIVDPGPEALSSELSFE